MGRRRSKPLSSKVVLHCLLPTVLIHDCHRGIDDWKVTVFLIILFLFIYLFIYLFVYVFIYLYVYSLFISITTEHKAPQFSFFLFNSLCACVHSKTACAFICKYVLLFH